MQSVLDEVRKHHSFREVWVGYLLGVVFFLISFWQGISSDARWFVIQQNIYSYGATLTAFLIVIGLSRLICYEKELGTDSLIIASNSGLFLAWKAKVIFAIGYCAIVVFSIGILSLLINGAQIGFKDALSPVSESVYFESVPLSNLLYCIVQYIFLFLGALYFAGFVLIIAAITKRTALTIILCGGAYIAFLGYYYVGRYWIQGTIFNQICDFLFHFGFSGFMLQESYSQLSRIDYLATWSQIWKPIVFVVIMIVIEFAGLWLLWGRKARK